MTSQTSKPSLLNVPDEMLTELFSYLPAKDRKNVRLTSHRLNETSSTFRIQKTEEIALYGNTNIVDSIMSLVNAARDVWNIRLHDMVIDTSVLPFFTKHGANIHSLAFHDCVLVTETGLLQEIIRCCRNLRSFSFIFTFERNWAESHWRCRPENIYEYNILNDLEALWNDEIICKNVVDLTLKLCYPLECRNIPHPILNAKFPHIFNVFPNVKKLDLCLTVDDHLRSHTFSLSLLCNQIMRLRHQLEKSSLKIICSLSRFCYGYVMESDWHELTNINFPELRELSLNSCIPPQRFDTTLADIFSTFNCKNLTSFDCVIQDVSSYHIELILNTAAKLRCLKIRMDENPVFFIRLQCFKALVKSNLVIFSMYSFYHETLIRCVVAVRPSDLSHSLLPNLTMEQLEIFYFNNRSLSLLLKYFPRLKTCQHGIRTITFQISSRSHMHKELFTPSKHKISSDMYRSLDSAK